MTLQEDFKSFLSNIEPSSSTVQEISSAQNSIRDYLRNHRSFSSHYLDSYLSGSYAKCTSIRPAKDDDNRDVDVIIEVDYDTESDSRDVLRELKDVLSEASKYSSARVQHHSVGVEFSRLDIDIVPLAVDAEDRFIGSSEDDSWAKTNSKGHIAWSKEVNEEHNGKFKPLVKIFKWWRRENCPSHERWPKGITLEKIVADNLPEDDDVYEDLVLGTMENIVDSLKDEVADGLVPTVVDPVLTENDLSDSYTNGDFKSFIQAIEDALDVIHASGSCNESWRKILGERFPVGSKALNEIKKTESSLSLDCALRVSYRKASPWPFTTKKPGVLVLADVTFPDGHVERISDGGRAIPKGCEIDYRVIRPQGMASLRVKWQIVNTGADATRAGCLRGNFEDANRPNGVRHEETAYEGLHYVQCLVLKNGRCVAHSKEFFIIVK